MTRLLRRAALVLVLLLTSCVRVYELQAIAGLTSALDSLPTVEGMTTFSIVRVGSGFTKTFGDTRCSYDQALLAIGTNLPGDEALATYIGELESDGWDVGRTRADGSTRIVRGDHLELWIDVGPPGFLVETDEAFTEKHGDYATVVNVGVNYWLPNREA